MEKEVMRINENWEEITKNISYILQFIDSACFMASSLSNFINNLSEGIHRIKCKNGHDDKKCETCRIKYKHCDCVLKHTNVKDDLIEFKCLGCNKSYQRKFDEKWKERFCNTYKFSNNDNNKFIIAKRCLFVWIYGWLGKIQWNIITGEGHYVRVLTSPDRWTYNVVFSIGSNFPIVPILHKLLH